MMHENAKKLHQQLYNRCGSTVAEWFRRIVERAETDSKFSMWINYTPSEKLQHAFIWERGSSTIMKFDEHMLDSEALLACRYVWERAYEKLYSTTDSTSEGKQP